MIAGDSTTGELIQVITEIEETRERKTSPKPNSSVPDL